MLARLHCLFTKQNKVQEIVYRSAYEGLINILFKGSTKEEEEIQLIFLIATIYK